MNIARFGPAGNSDLFFERGHKSVAEAPEWVAGMGLNAYEYQGGHGIRISEKDARKIAARRQGTELKYPSMPLIIFPLPQRTLKKGITA